MINNIDDMYANVDYVYNIFKDVYKDNITKEEYELLKSNLILRINKCRFIIKVLLNYDSNEYFNQVYLMLSELLKSIDKDFNDIKSYGKLLVFYDDIDKTLIDWDLNKKKKINKQICYLNKNHDKELYLSIYNELDDIFKKLYKYYFDSPTFSINIGLLITRTYGADELFHYYLDIFDFKSEFINKHSNEHEKTIKR